MDLIQQCLQIRPPTHLTVAFHGFNQLLYLFSTCKRRKNGLCSSGGVLLKPCKPLFGTLVRELCLLQAPRKRYLIYLRGYRWKLDDLPFYLHCAQVFKGLRWVLSNGGIPKLFQIYCVESPSPLKP